MDRRVITFLRGINVGGKTLEMEKMKTLLVDLGLANVRVFNESGNLVFETTLAPSAVVRKIEDKILTATGLQVAVITRSVAEMQKILSNNPFTKAQDADSAHLYVSFMLEAPEKVALRALSKVHAGRDRFRNIDREIYLHCPDGYSKSRLTNDALERALNVVMTTRDWNALTHLGELL